MAMRDVDVKLIETIIHRNAAESDVQQLLESFAGQPVILESKNGKQAIDLSFLTGLLNSPVLKQILPLLVPFLLTLLSGGGLSAGTLIPLLIKVISQLLGVGESTAKAMLMQSLQSPASQEGGA